jgi:1-acyl-sn-glycerol-3-phosphate acyltransferase
VKLPGFLSLPVLHSLLLLLGLLSLSWNLVALLIYPFLPRRQGLRLGRAMIAWCYHWFWMVARWTGILQTRLDALDALRDEPGLIVVANHPSMLDALMLVSRLPRSACVMKASLMRNVFLGPGARLARYVPNDPPRAMMRSAVADLRQGGQLVLFPEGTRTTTPDINRFRPGFTLMAKMAQAPIQTVLIDIDSPYLSKGWPLWRLPPLPIVFSVRLGKRFAPSADPNAQLADIEAYFRTEVGRPRSTPSCSHDAC